MSWGDLDIEFHTAAVAFSVRMLWATPGDDVNSVLRGQP